MKPIDVERYLADNASAEVRARIEATMAANAEFAERIRRRRAERRAFAVDPRRRRFSDLVREAEAEKTSLTRRSEVSTRRWAMAAVLASGAAVGLAIAPLSTDVPARVGDASMRTKGGTSVRLAVARVDGTVAAYAPGDTLHPGDRIRISVRAVAEGFVSVLLEEREGDVQVIYGAAELGRLPRGASRASGKPSSRRPVGLGAPVHCVFAPAGR